MWWARKRLNGMGVPTKEVLGMDGLRAHDVEITG
jgi:hypothetical protein